MNETVKSLIAQIAALLDQLVAAVAPAQAQTGLVYHADGRWEFVQPAPNPELDGRMSGGDFEAGVFTPGRTWTNPEWRDSHNKVAFVRANAAAVVNGHRKFSTFVSSLEDIEDERDIANYVWYNRALFQITDEEAVKLLNT